MLRVEIGVGRRGPPRCRMTRLSARWVLKGFSLDTIPGRRLTGGITTLPTSVFVLHFKMLVGACCCFGWAAEVQNIREEHLLAVHDMSIQGSTHFLDRQLHVSSGIQVADTAVICRQHDIPERVMKDVGEFPIEVN